VRPDVPEPNQQPLDLRMELHATLRRADARPATMKEFVTDLGLELADLARDGRLRAIEQACGACDTAGRHHGREGFELTDVKGRSIHLTYDRRVLMQIQYEVVIATSHF
jgi:hypothetical protein